MSRVDNIYGTQSTLLGVDLLFYSMIVNSLDVMHPTHPYAQRNFLALGTFAVCFAAGYFDGDSMSLGVKSLYYSGACRVIVNR